MENLEKIAIEIEQTVLGMLLANPGLIDRYSLTADEFGEPLHAEMFAQIQAKAAEGQQHTPLTLGAMLSAEPPIGDVTIPEYVRRVYARGFSDSTPGTIDALKDVSLRRRLAAVADALKWSASDPRTGIIADAANALGQIDSVLAANRLIPTSAKFYDIASDTIDDILNDDGASRITTGLASLDRELGGWHRGQYSIIAGRPGMGKSMLAVSTAIRAAKKGAGVAIFSLEMTKHEVMIRALSDMSYTRVDPIAYQLASSGRMEDHHVERWARIANEYRDLPLFIDDQRGLTVSEIAARCRKRRSDFERLGKTLDLIIVDHMGLVRASDRYRGNKVQEVGEVSDGLATLAKDANAAVIALSQLSRATESRDNKRPTLADLRNSGDIEQDAHVVAFAYRKAYYLERMTCDPGTQEELQRQAELEACRNTMELLIAKNRNGPTDAVTLFCDPACNAVRDFQR